MKAFQKLVSISAAFAMLMGGCRGNMPGEIPSENLHSVSTEDSDIVASGECGAEGDNLTWTFDDNGTLTISGKGAIMDYEYDSASPWHNYRYDILNIKIENGVTSIGERAFCTCSSLTSITIPDSVTSIGSFAFETCSSLTTITIPDNVTSIGEYAFYDCSSLTSITIPDSVTTIESCAFGHCSSLTSITIPDSVTSIESDAFDWCSSLTAIDVDTNNEYYASEDGVLFNKNKTELIQYPIAKDNQKYMIPDSVTSIESYAFYHCSLTSITIPDSVTTIEYCAFNQCSSLTSITIPDSVTSIGLFAFYDCSRLTAIDVDTNNEYYASEDGVLFNKNKTVLIQYPIEKDNQKYMIPDSVTSIGDRAFEYCTSLTSITIPESVTSIGLGAFEYCFSLTSITIPDSVTSIGDFAFEECSSLTSITLNNPNCKIFDSKSTIHYSATIYGYEGSTAQAYAEKYDREFISLG